MKKVSLKEIVECWLIKGYGPMIGQPVELPIFKVGSLSVAVALCTLPQCNILVGQSGAIRRKRGTAVTSYEHRAVLTEYSVLLMPSPLSCSGIQQMRREEEETQTYNSTYTL
jgi:hypothetical protein